MCSDDIFDSIQLVGKMAAVELRVYGRLKRHLSTHGRRLGHKTAKVNRCISRRCTIRVLSAFSAPTVSVYVVVRGEWRAIYGLDQGACGGREGRRWVQELQKVRRDS